MIVEDEELRRKKYEVVPLLDMLDRETREDVVSTQFEHQLT
jgi:hypothetical protein